MNLLIIDGNSIINRAFFGIKLLTAKDGHYTNAIYGFMNTLLHLTDEVQPDGIAVAFDVKQPTFRHKIYPEYKAGRRGMPPELFEQMEPLKVLLKAYGCHIIECPGYEADDILGTLAHNCKAPDHAYIATGDRDSLQLVSDDVTVLLTTTKNQTTQTVAYTPAGLMEEYGLTPEEMIELKALQGDNSDNIPGVPGIGPKTAGELIRKYHSVENIYAQLDTLEATAGVKNKLAAGKESAELSKFLGTICLETPIITDIENYRLLLKRPEILREELVRHEMFKLLRKLDLTPENSAGEKTGVQPDFVANRIIVADVKQAITQLGKSREICFYVKNDITVQNGFVGFVADGEYYFVPDGNADVFQAFCNSNAEKCVYSSKELYKYAEKKRYELKNIVFDICLAAYLLNPNTTDFSLGNMALSYGIPSVEINVNDGTVMEEEQCFIGEMSRLFLLQTRFKALLEDRNQRELLTDMEIPLARVLASMENTGMAVNKEEIAAHSVILSEKIKALEEKIHAAAGHTFNINSPKQLGTVLFEELGLPVKKKTKTGYSTNAEVLEELAGDYEIVSLILEYRTYAKLKSTYCEGLLKAVEPDGRIRSTFNQTETRTGRLSSTEPNLQNIPVRTPEGREFRKFFCAEEGFTLVDADYSQIELRVLASMANDKNMTAAFREETDIHTLTASKVFNVPVEAVTPELRSASKAVNFGIIYGIGAFSLAKDIHTTRKEAEAFINSYLSLYAGVGAYFDKCIADARKNGYVTTLFNRRRYLPELKNSNRMIAAFGERVARNMPIQGTSADIIKIAMIRVYERLKRELPDTKLIMQVHDELILEAPLEDAAKAGEILKEEMENAVKLQVKLRVDVGIGKTWYEAKA